MERPTNKKGAPLVGTAFAIVLPVECTKSQYRVTLDALAAFCNNHFSFWAFAPHVPDDTHTFNHIHVVGKTETRHSIQGVLSWLKEFLGQTEAVQVEICNYFSSSIRYLVHKDQPDKTPYPDSIIQTSDQEELKGYLYQRRKMTPEAVVKMVKNGASIEELFIAFGSDLARILNVVKELQRQRSVLLFNDDRIRRHVAFENKITSLLNDVEARRIAPADFVIYAREALENLRKLLFESDSESGKQLEFSRIVEKRSQEDESPFDLTGLEEDKD